MSRKRSVPAHDGEKQLPVVAARVVLDEVPQRLVMLLEEARLDLDQVNLDEGQNKHIHHHILLHLPISGWTKESTYKFETTFFVKFID